MKCSFSSCLTQGLTQSLEWIQRRLACWALVASCMMLVPMLGAQTFDSFAPVFTHSGLGVWNVGLRPDGKVFASGIFSQVNGEARFRFAGLRSDGSLDETFDVVPMEPMSNFATSIRSISFQRDGKMLVAGYFTKIAGADRGSIARLLPNGKIDPTFSTGFDNYNLTEVVRVRPDGKIMVGGRFRLLPSGSRDLSFQTMLKSSSQVQCLVIQPDESMVVVGTLHLNDGSSAAVARMKPNGTHDQDFQLVTGTNVRGCALQPDGRILVWGSFTSLGGQPRMNLARLEPNGVLDETFTPQISSTVIGLQLQSDGKIVVSGSFVNVGGQQRTYLARLTSDGTLDPGFQNVNISGGWQVSGLFLQPDGKMLISGDFSTQGSGSGIFRRVTNPTPAVESLTAADGTIVWERSGSAPEVTSVVFQVWNGSGWSSDIPAERSAEGWRATGVTLPSAGWIRASGQRAGGAYNSNSTFLEKTAPFGGMGAVQVTIEQPVGSVVAHESLVDFGSYSIAGDDEQRTFRIRNSGSVPILGLKAVLTSLNNAFSLETAIPQQLAPGQFSDFTVRFSNLIGGESVGGVMIQSDSPGQSPFEVRLRGVRFQHLSSFPETNGAVWTSAQQPDGKMLIGGEFTQVGGVPKLRLARLMAKGELDPDFAASANGRVSCLLVLADRSILVGGNFTQINGQSAPHFARLDERGALLQPFASGLNSEVYALAIDGNGRILVGGAFTTVNGVTRRFLIRLLANGEVDESLSASPNSLVRSLLVDSSQGFYCGGDFTAVGGNARQALAYFNANGSLSSFNAQIASGSVYALASSSEGWVWAGGSIYLGGESDGWGLIRIGGASGVSAPPRFNGLVRSLATVAGGGCVVGGDFFTVGGRSQRGLVKLLANGTVDPTFRPSPNGNVHGVSVLENGSILVMGSFATMAGRPRSNLAMIPPTTGLSAPTLTGNGFEFTWGVPIGSPDFSFVQLERWNGTSWQFSGNCSKQGSGWRSPWSSAPSAGWVRMLGRVAGGSLLEQRVAYGSSAGRPQLEIRNDQGVVVPTGGVLDFGQGQWRSVSVEHQLVLKNTGGSVLQNLLIESASAHADDFVVVESPGSSSLAPGAETVVKIVFLPNRLGLCSALLRIRNNDPLQQPFEVLLTGFGHQARASYAPDPNGTVLVSAELQNARLMVGGNFSSFKGVAAGNLARLLPDGGLDSTFTGHTDGPVHALQRLPNGRVIVGGNFTSLGGLARRSLAVLTSDGNVDPSFSANAVGAVNALAVQQDGGVLVGGTFTSLAGQVRLRLGRLQASGALDLDFNPVFDNQVNAIAIQSDGKILVGGSFSLVNGAAAPNLVRLLPDGTRDSTFSAGIQNGAVSCIQILEDNCILIGGSFGRVGGQLRSNLAKLLPSGALDESFSVAPNGAVLTMLKTADQVVHVGGHFTTLNGGAHHRLARILPTGLIDHSYNPEADGVVQHLALLSDGDIIVGGSFDRIGGLPLAKLARMPASSRPWLRLSTLTQTFNGSLRPVSVQVFPPDLQVEVTYDGSPTPPINAGVYQVTARVTSHTYSAESADFLVVLKTTQTIQFPQPPSQYADAEVQLVATGGGSGNPVTFTVVEGPGLVTPPARLSFSASGGVLVQANQAGDTNHHAATSVQRQIVVQRAAASIQLTSLRHSFDRWPKGAQAVTTPPNLNVQFLYGGSAELPVNPGAYPVQATVNDPRYVAASAVGILEIDHRHAITLAQNAVATSVPETEPTVWTNDATGIYNGLLVDPENEQTVFGAIENLIVKPARGSRSPAFSGVLRLPKLRLPFRGVLTHASGFELTVWRKGQAFVFQLGLERTDVGLAFLRGTVAWGSVQTQCSAARSSFHRTRQPVPSNLAGRYTFLMPSANGHDLELPAGDGWAVATLSKAGAIRLSGMLPDGVRWTESARFSDDWSFDLYRALYVTRDNAGFVGGRVTLRESAGISDADAVLHWVKPESLRTSRYPKGFEIYPSVVGAHYVRPPSRQAAILEWGAGLTNPNTETVIFSPLFEFGNGGALRFPTFWSRSNHVVGGDGVKLSAKLNQGNGVFSGRYRGARPWNSVPFQGVILPTQERVAGVFLLPQITGAIRLQSISE